MDLEIPITLDGFTSQWLTTAFEHDGRGYGTVTAARAERIAVGEGFLGELARLHLSYAEGNEGPQTLIAKIPTTDGALKPLGVMLGVYERESLFYEQVASKLEIRIPEAYYLSLIHI